MMTFVYAHREVFLLLLVALSSAFIAWLMDIEFGGQPASFIIGLSGGWALADSHRRRKDEEREQRTPSTK
jgi:hypothetical protein